MAAPVAPKIQKKPRLRDASPVRPTNYQGYEEVVNRAHALKQKLEIKRDNADVFDSMVEYMKMFEEEGRVSNCTNCDEWYENPGDHSDECPICKEKHCDGCLGTHTKLCTLKAL